ncbi:MAG: isochorismatase family protein [Dehalococcoidia bacterium]|nr:isochorismatase family protein [Dehalococcoidia bacterium]
MNTAAWQIPSYIARWFKELKPLALNQAAADPSRVGLFSVDMIAGFLSTGNLASERVGKLAQPVAQVFQKAYQQGIRTFVLFQDTHHPQTPEFDAFPRHAVAGTEESQTIPELRSLPFSKLFTVIEKNSLHPALDTGFDSWLDEHKYVNTAVVVGNCTDLCVYQMAMYLRLRANARNYRDYKVIVPANAVDTYDIAEGATDQSGVRAHPGDFFHQVFLYHMALNGMRVVRELT